MSKRAALCAATAGIALGVLGPVLAQVEAFPDRGAGRPRAESPSGERGGAVPYAQAPQNEATTPASGASPAEPAKPKSSPGAVIGALSGLIGFLSIAIAKRNRS